MNTPFVNPALSKVLSPRAKFSDLDSAIAQAISSVVPQPTTNVPAVPTMENTEPLYQQMGGHITSPEDLEPFFQEASQQTGVDIRVLKAIAKQESGFNPNARSKAGAIGVMQLMPGTAKYLGVQNPYDARSNILGGARYFKEQLNTFGNDMSKALAAYNAGPGNVRKYGGIPPFAETQQYVRRIMNGGAIHNAMSQMNYR